MSTYHIRSFGSGDGEFQIGIFLPVSEQQRELGQEPVVDVAHCGYRLRVGVAVDASFEGLGSANEPLPGLKIIRVVELESQHYTDPETISDCRIIPTRLPAS
jgi:hypothetical protein